MKPTTVLTSSGAIAPRDRVSARLAGLLVDAMMRVGGKRAALAGFEVHHVLARACSSRAACAGFVEHRQIHAEGRVGGLGSGDGLKHQIDRRAAPHGFHLRGHMRQHADLRGNFEATRASRSSMCSRPPRSRRRRMPGSRRSPRRRSHTAGRRSRWPRCRANRQWDDWAATASKNVLEGPKCRGNV